MDGRHTGLHIRTLVHKSALPGMDPTGPMFLYSNLPAGIVQSQWFLQLDALMWLLRTVDTLWTIPKLIVRVSMTLIKIRNGDQDLSTLKWKWRNLRTQKKSSNRLGLPKTFLEAKKLIMMLLGLYCCMCIPIARAALTSCPLYTARALGHNLIYLKGWDLVSGFIFMLLSERI
jgi:hypothetical protein